jgi:hypothetical protein
MNSPGWRHLRRPVAASTAIVSRLYSREYEEPSASSWVIVVNPAGISRTPAVTVVIQVVSPMSVVDQRTVPDRASWAVSRRLPRWFST